MTTPPWAADLANRLDRIEATLHLGGRSRWLPLPVAAEALGLPSAAALRKRIDRGTIPPQYVQHRVSAAGRRVDVRVDVESYLGR